jgi:hypothetical protein
MDEKLQALNIHSLLTGGVSAITQLIWAERNRNVRPALDVMGKGNAARCRTKQNATSKARNNS